MIRNRILGVLKFTLVTALLGWASLAYAQPAYPYKKYENRKEGLVKSRQHVAGEKLVLLSAAIENNEAMPQTSFDRYHYVFSLSAASRVKITVREFEKVYNIEKMEYRMEPLQSDYPAGMNKFSWPAEIPRYYKLTINDLVPLANASGSEFDTIVPVLLFYAAPMNSEVSYRFCFFPLQSISVLNYKIYRARPSELVYSAQLRDLPGEQKTYLRWPGKDMNNRPASSGLYNLVIEATFRRLLGANAQKLTTTYQFYHDTQIMTNSNVRR